MWFIRAVVFTGLLAAPAAAQLKLNIQQLTSFIESSIKLKQEDKRVAEYVKKVQLTERLDDRTIEVWQGKGLGPKTVEALRNLVDASQTLPKPAAAVARPAAPVIPPPPPEEQRRVLDQARDYAMNYSKRLPDFICTQVTRRYYDPTGLEFWRGMDTITEKLTYFEQKEDYKVVTVDGRLADTTHDKLGGATSSGEFGSMMKEVFDPKTETRFHWLRWGTLRGRRNHVYAYSVSQSRSQWRIDYQRTMEIVPAYRGLIYVDADLLTVTRITLEAIDIPPTFPIQLARTTLDYDFIKIGEAEHVLPLRAEIRMREGRTLVKNEVEFRMYRKFGAEATIKFETPEPLPEDVTKEQPAQPTPAKPPNE